MEKKRLAHVRKFNKVISNPINKLIAGRFLYSLVYHVGRKSGKAYSTPVIAELAAGRIYVPLPYGVDTDWRLNVQAAGKCQLKINGKLYSAANPERVGVEIGQPNFPPFFQKVFQLVRVKHYLQLRVVAP
jgi:hypothetical protein